MAATMIQPGRGTAATPAGRGRTDGQSALLMALFLISLFVLQFDIRRWTGTERSVTVELQADLANVALLATLALGTLLGGAVIVRRPRRFATLAAVAFVPFFAWMYAATLFGSTALKGALQLTTLVAGFVMLLALVDRFGRTTTASAFVWFQGIYSGLSVASFFLLPSLSRFRLWNGVPGFRLNGLSGHPNGISAMAGLAVLVLVATWPELRMPRWVKWLMVALFLAVVLLAQSRTAALAIIVTCALALCLRHPRMILLAIPGAVLVAFLIGVIVYNPELLLVFSRTDAGELTTFTGRTFIWDYSRRLIADSPLVGYGYGSTWYMFREVAPILSVSTNGYVFPHSHNLFLQLMLNGGVPAVLTFLAGCVILVAECVRLRDVLAFCLLLYYFMFSTTAADGFYQYLDSYLLSLCMAVAMLSRHAVEGVTRRAAASRGPLWPTRDPHPRPAGG